jgi:methionyl-tRNA synthetase
MTRIYLSTTLPYVNARPHIGFALELVQADVLARHHRQRGDEVRLQSGTDDNSLKNVLAAEAAGVPVAEFVDANAAAFEALRGPLDLSVDGFVRTSRDARHRAGVHRLWQECAAADDLYRKHYTGLYCVGCEQFYDPGDLVDGRCPEHGTEPQEVAEENWFFRLSRYTERLYDLIATGRLRIEPVSRRNEVLALIAGGLRDLSISRSRARARGWGIAVPGDPDQVVYVWWDALANYVTGLDYGRTPNSAEYRRWWVGADRRVHLVGKGVLRFHAVYWPALLLSAGLPLPTEIFVHDYLTVGGRKISKSSGTGFAPADLVRRHGTDAVRWWLLREVPRVGDVDFTEDRLVARADEDLANGIGNLVHRVVSLVHRYRDGWVPAVPVPDGAADLVDACAAAPAGVDAALADFDFRGAAGAVWRIVVAANRYVERVRPWGLARDPARAGELDGCLAALVGACRALAEELAPLVPGAAARIARQCAGERLPAAERLFARLGSTRRAG